MRSFGVGGQIFYGHGGEGQKELLRRIWGMHHSEDTHYIRILVRQLRKKIDPFEKDLIETMPKQGYRIAVDKPEAN